MTDASAQQEHLSIRPAVWPGDEAFAIDLLQNYAKYLASGHGGAARICLEGYSLELAGLVQRWSTPNGVLLLAFVDSRPAGCVAIKVRHDRPGSCEMKRLWVEGHARGHGLGRSLAHAAIDWARRQGSSALLLDTVPEAMPQAVALYLSLGFRVTNRHNNNPVPDLQFMQLDL